MSKSLYLFLFVTATIISGCQVGQEITPPITATHLPIAQYGEIPEITLRVTPSLPQPTDAMFFTPSPRVLSTPSIQPTSIITPGLFVDSKNDLAHDLIVFTSLNIDAIPSLRDELSFNDLGDLLQFKSPQLWAISPDGKTVGRLTEPEMAYSLYIPSTPEGSIVAVNYSISLNNPIVKPVRLPQECFNDFNKHDDVPNLLPCSNFTFSPDGQYLAFFFGEDICGRGVLVVAASTGDVVFRLDGRGHSFYFLRGRAAMLVNAGSCEGSVASLINLHTGTEDILGQGPGWMVSDNLIMGYTPDYDGGGTSIWGYNLASGQYFMSLWGVIGPSIWSPDSSDFIYQGWNIITSTESTVTFGSSQIMRVDIASNSTDVLLGDKDYDYHLCDREENDLYEQCYLYGDWILVRRFKSQERVYAWDNVAYADLCFRYGWDCAEPESRFALNFRTGEMIAWDKFQLPVSTMTPIASPTSTPGPDLLKEPIYVHPTEHYAFYVGVDGHSLWLVSPNSEPVMWVDDGSDFFYLP